MNLVTKDKLLDVVLHIFAEEFNVSPDKLTLATVILHIEGADSVKQLRALARLEDEFDISLMKEGVPPVRRLTDLVDQISDALAGDNREASQPQLSSIENV